MLNSKIYTERISMDGTVNGLQFLQECFRALLYIENRVDMRLSGSLASKHISIGECVSQWV